MLPVSLVGWWPRRMQISVVVRRMDAEVSAKAQFRVALKSSHKALIVDAFVSAKVT